MTRQLWIFATALFASHVLALTALQGSPCFDICNGNEATSSADIVCVDDDYTNTTKGETLTSCITCLQSSNYKTGFMTDSTLFLYYISTVQQTCLSGMPGPPISKCNDDCSALPSAFSAINGRAFFSDPWSFCSANDNSYQNDASGCATCLQSQENTVILGNFVYVGNLGCQNQPDVANGVAVYTDDDLFNTAVLGEDSSSSSSSAAAASSTTAKSTSSSATATSTSNSSATKSSTSPSVTAASASSSSSESESDSDDKSSGNGGLSRGAAAGIGVTMGILGVLLIILLAILARRRMARREAGAAGGEGPWAKMRDSPPPQMQERGATPPGAGVFVPPPIPVAATSMAKRSKSFKSVASKSTKSIKNITPRLSEWYYAANPKRSDDLSALPQRGWD